MIFYKKNTSSQQDILNHFLNCDQLFQNHLSRRINLNDYVLKLTEKSQRYEAWEGSELAGLVAVYHNKDPEKSDFISNVSVAIKYQGKGIASQLMTMAMNYSSETQAIVLRLEVEADNFSAQSLYKKLGFEQEIKTEFWSLNLKEYRKKK